MIIIIINNEQNAAFCEFVGMCVGTYQPETQLPIGDFRVGGGSKHTTESFPTSQCVPHNSYCNRNILLWN